MKLSSREIRSTTVELQDLATSLRLTNLARVHVQEFADDVFVSLDELTVTGEVLRSRREVMKPGRAKGLLIDALHSAGKRVASERRRQEEQAYRESAELEKQRAIGEWLIVMFTGMPFAEIAELIGE